MLPAFHDISDHSSVFLSAGLTVDRFVTIMSSKMSAQDEDEHIRQMFLAFDMQCMCLPIAINTALSFSMF